MKYTVLIDAGYLFAEGSKLLFNEVTGVHIDLEALTKNLNERIENHYHEQSVKPLRHLRSYWYDAKDRSDWVAQCPGYTLRLGRVNAKGQQKGVDGAIIRELLTLGNNRAVDDVFILSGDEDIIEGVHAAKDLGIYVGMLRIDTNVNNMSNRLMREADGFINLDKMFFEKVITQREYGEIKGSSEHDDTFQFIYKDIFERLTPQEMFDRKPQIPRDVDKLILMEISQGNDLEPEKRQEIRGDFWSFVERQVKSGNA